MSDEEEYEYEYDDDGDNMEEDNPFEYTDEEDEQDDAQVALENAYYNAKGLRETSAAEAASAFEQVIEQERRDGGAYGPWSFKAMKQLVKLHLRLQDPHETRKHYSRLLQCIATGNNISPNAVEKGINGMLERVASRYQQNNNSQQQTGGLSLAVYDETLQVFHPQTGACKNERLWFKANIKYGQLLYEMHETPKLQAVLKDLLTVQQQQQAKNTSSNSTTTTSSSSTQTMEIYALQIQLYSRQHNHKLLRETFQKAMSVRGGIPHPRTVALMQELGGKMHMAAREYEAASQTFFQAFKSYDEAGDAGRLRCLKYLVLASMLHASTINPFDSQEARPYKDDPEIVAMNALVQAFHTNDIVAFERTLRRVQQDEFVKQHAQNLLRTVRRQVLRRILRPYQRISLQSMAQQLCDISTAQVEELLVGLILDGSLPNARMDRVAGVLIKEAELGGGDAPTSSSTSSSASVAVANNAKKPSPIQERCQVLEDMIGRLEALSTQVTNLQVKEGAALRGIV